MAIHNDRNISRSNQFQWYARSTFERNLSAKANSKKPSITLTLFSQPPDFGKLFIADGNKANTVNGNASATEKPSIPTAGPRRSPFDAASTNSVPIIGPVHEND